MVTLPVQRKAVSNLREVSGYSERLACNLMGVARSSYRYIPKARKADEEVLRKGINELAHRYPRYGCPRVTEMLNREGWKVNEKRVHRIWKEDGLQVKRKPKKRRRGPKGEVVNKAEYTNHVWSYDFMEDRTESGNRVRFLNLVDEYTRECLAIEASRSSGAVEVIECLEWTFLTRGAPKYIRSDNGPEFVAQAVRAWLTREGCKTIYIEPGSPWENAYIESFNGKFRDECLNMELFRNIKEAQQVADSWRKEYNYFRPHSSLGYLTPKEFAATAPPHPPRAGIELNPIIPAGT